MASTQLYVGTKTPFGTITWVSGDVYGAQATVRAKDGSETTYRLPFLLAHGFKVEGRKA